MLDIDAVYRSFSIDCKRSCAVILQAIQDDISKEDVYQILDNSFGNYLSTRLLDFWSDEEFILLRQPARLVFDFYSDCALKAIVSKFGHRC